MAKKKNVVLLDVIEPERDTSLTDGAKGCSCANGFEPIGLLYVDSHLKNLGHEVRTFSQMTGATRDELVKKTVELNPEVVGIKTLTHTIHDAVYIASKVKDRLPESKIVFGGDHATACPQLIKEVPGSYVIAGEGEIAMGEFLRFSKGEISEIEVPSLSWIDSQGDLVTNKRAVRTSNLDNFPTPTRYKELLKLSKIGGYMNPSAEDQVSVAVVETSRGCPYDCSFCGNNDMWESKVKFRSPKAVCDELESLVDKYGTNTVFFTDLSFNASRRHVEGLCNEIERRDIPINWYAMANLHKMDGELAYTMAKGKCAKLGFGIESFIPETALHAKGPIASVSFERANEILTQVNKSGIITKGYFLIGFPEETMEMYDSLIDQIGKLHVKEIRVGFPAPFPGTADAITYKDRISQTDYSKWDTLSGPVIRQDYLTPDELLATRNRIYERFNSEK